jgi:hypothetical protein
MAQPQANPQHKVCVVVPFCNVAQSSGSDRTSWRRIPGPRRADDLFRSPDKYTPLTICDHPWLGKLYGKVTEIGQASVVNSSNIFFGTDHMRR